MSAPPYMRFYVAEYLADNHSLTTLEHGAYLLLIMEYWRNGRLPTDDEGLAKICRLSGEHWLSVRSAIAQRFDENWRHKRIDRELELAEEKSAKAYKAALKSLETRSKKRSLNKRSTNAKRTLSNRSHIKDIDRVLSTSSQVSRGPVTPSAGFLATSIVRGIRGGAK